MLRGREVMVGKLAQSKPAIYWDRAGEQGYGRAMYRSAEVESHVRGRFWKIAIDFADELGVSRDGQVIDVGCGDGAFANRVLASHYRVVDGIDKAERSIKRAQTEAKPNARFRAVDLVTFNYNSLLRYDAAFLIGILHHVKHATPSIVEALVQRADKMIVLEPNGNHLIRKLLEFTPVYREAGEDSFRTEELINIFEKAGWKTVIYRRLNLFPNFTPGFIYRWLGPLEPKIEASRVFNALCTVGMYGLDRC
jgi:SAM-dependent methyltransferase